MDQPRNKGGRPKGSLNKATREFRETVQSLLDAQGPHIPRYLQMVAEGDESKGLRPDPGKALDLLAKLAEFAAPKLGRVEHVGDPENPLRTVTRIELAPLNDNGKD